MIATAGAQDLVAREGFRFVYRTAEAFDKAAQRADRLRTRLGVRSQAENTARLAQAEPALRVPLAGALHWLDSWAVNDPGALVQRYAELFVARGGRLLTGDAASLQP